MSTFVSEQSFFLLKLRENMPYKDNIRATNCVIACNLRFPDFTIQNYFPITGMVKAIYDYITRHASYEQMKAAFEQSHKIITKEPLTGADVRKVFEVLQILLEKYCEVLVDNDMVQTVPNKEKQQRLL